MAPKTEPYATRKWFSLCVVPKFCWGPYSTEQSEHPKFGADFNTIVSMPIQLNTSYMYECRFCPRISSSLHLRRTTTAADVYM